MNKKLFEQIYVNLQKRIDLCREQFDTLSSGISLEDLSIKQVKNLITFSKEEYEIQTHILMIDLYHILGMGNLTAIQVTTLVKLIKEYSSYRSLLNDLGKKEPDLNNLPVINLKPTKYNSTFLGGFVLGDADGRDLATDELLVKNSSNTTEKIISDSDDLPYTYFNRSTGEIHYLKDRVNELASYLIKNTDLFANFKYLALRERLLSTGHYGNYSFFVNDTEGIGCLNVPESDTLANLVKRLNIPERLS